MFILIVFISFFLECQSRFEKPEAWFKYNNRAIEKKMEKNREKSDLSLRSQSRVTLTYFENIQDNTLNHRKPRLKRYEDACKSVCEDLPLNDNEPVCMMFSRYKKGFLAFINQCHARRAVCRENLLLHMVHPSRCLKSKQYFMTV